MQKEWFIWVGNQTEGPYSFEELRRDRRITPDTLAWKEGMPDWKPIGQIDELAPLFKDDEDRFIPEEELDLKKKKLPEDEVIALRQEPPNLMMWIVIVMIVLFIVASLFR